MNFQPPAPPVIGGIPRNHSGRGNHPVDHIVIHSAVMPCEAGRARQLAEMNQRGSSGGSWHYSVDPYEEFQCSWDSYVCWAAPPNPHKIHIEMADNPGPVPDLPRDSAKWKKLKASWRWARKPQRLMLRRTARLTAELALGYDIPIRFVGVPGLLAGKRGITVHDNVSRAFKQSTHWDPGFWPRFWFMFLVRRHAARVRRQERRG